MEKTILDLLGWLGAALYLAAYALVSLKKLEGNSNLFQVMNVAAGVMLVVNSAYYGALPSVALNLIWMGIGVFVIGQNARRKRKA